MNKTVPLFIHGVLRPFEHIEADIIFAALCACGGDVSKTARALRLSKPTVYKKISDHCIDLAHIRKESAK